jgi:hypothetical protein
VLIIFVSDEVVVVVIPLLKEVLLVAAHGPSLSASSSSSSSSSCGAGLVLFERLMTVENNVVVVFGEFLCIGDGDASLLPPFHFFLDIKK